MVKMKLIIQNDRIAATANDEYEGLEAWLPAPRGFDLQCLADYRVIDGALVLAPPPSVSRKQARKALLLAGLFEAVQPAIDAIEDPLQRQLVQIDWDDAQTYERDDPTLLSLAAALGMSDEQLDALFVTAAGL